MKAGDVVKISWADGECAVGLFLRNERGFAVFEGDDGEEFVALIRDSTRMEVIGNKSDLSLENL